MHEFDSIGFISYQAYNIGSGARVTYNTIDRQYIQPRDKASTMVTNYINQYRIWVLVNKLISNLDNCTS